MALRAPTATSLLAERRHDAVDEGGGGYDALVLATDHDAFDYAMLLKHARLIVDARGAYPVSAPNVIKA